MLLFANFGFTALRIFVKSEWLEGSETTLSNCFTVASVVSEFSALWTVTPQVPLSMGFSSQEYWSGLPCPPPGDLPNPQIKPTSLMYPALAGGFFTTSATWEAR